MKSIKYTIININISPLKNPVINPNILLEAENPIILTNFETKKPINDDKKNVIRKILIKAMIFEISAELMKVII